MASWQSPLTDAQQTACLDCRKWHNLIALPGLDFNAPPKAGSLFPSMLPSDLDPQCHPLVLVCVQTRLGASYTMSHAVHAPLLSPGPRLWQTRAWELRRGEGTFLLPGQLLSHGHARKTLKALLEKEEEACWNPTRALLSPLRATGEKTWLSLGLESCRFRQAHDESLHPLILPAAVSSCSLQRVDFSPALAPPPPGVQINGLAGKASL